MRNLPALVVVFTLMTGCASKANISQLTSVEIGMDAPLGATPSQVIAVLDSKHIEHSSYSIDASKGRILTAVSRDRASWQLIRVDHVLEFRFDSSDRLVTKIAKDYLTGP